MCGIGAVVAKRAREVDDLSGTLLRMADSIRHRGPDDGGVFVSPDGRAGLANRRLAIRDLSPAGHMPMTAADGQVAVTYNGEVYNTAELRAALEAEGHAFRSHSDTEVLLRGYLAWGARVVDRLRGMFAFAVLDLRPGHRCLFVGRDRLGIKPLYCADTPDALVFGSELRAVMASGLVERRRDPAALVGYLMLGSVPNPLTPWAGVRSLEPGCTWTIPLDGTGGLPDASRYWRLPEGGAGDGPSAEEAGERVAELLAESVAMRMVSDVPIGAFLSGGLDSSAVVALMRASTTGVIRTCSMVFEEAEFSEAPYARAMADAAGADHWERVVTAAEFAAHLDGALDASDQPTVDGINTYFVSQTARQAGLTVAMSGLGGDELFGGYGNTFGGVPRLLSAVAAARSVPGGGALASALLGLHPARERTAKVRDAFRRPPSRASAYLACRGLFSPSQVRALVRPEVWEAAAAGFDPVAHLGGLAGSPNGPVFNWVSRAELGSYTHQQLLRDTDAMSMAHSLEVRVPLLDHRLVEYVLRLPPAAKTAGAGPKPLLTRAVGALLPPEVLAPRPKQGFTFPFQPWLRGPLRARVREALDQRPDYGMLRRDAVERTWRDFQAGRLHWSRVWALAVL
ncbi:MAG: Asparagine synthetase [Gemmatimonadetes bacterium]|nr:Asparagine synthetase [Gemmatimonadota bacterium]